MIQTNYRRWHAKRVVEDLRRQKNIRLEWEAEEKQKKQREKERLKQLDYIRRHNPKTKEDFELLYNALECKLKTGFAFSTNLKMINSKNSFTKDKNKTYFWKTILGI